MITALFSAAAVIFLFAIASRPALALIKPLIQKIQVALCLKVKWLRCEADYSPPSSARLWMHVAVPTLPHMSSWCDYSSTGQLYF